MLVSRVEFGAGDGGEVGKRGRGRVDKLTTRDEQVD